MAYEEIPLGEMFGEIISELGVYYIISIIWPKWKESALNILSMSLSLADP